MAGRAVACDAAASKNPECRLSKMTSMMTVIPHPFGVLDLQM